MRIRLKIAASLGAVLAAAGAAAGVAHAAGAFTSRAATWNVSVADAAPGPAVDQVGPAAKADPGTLGAGAPPNTTAAARPLGRELSKGQQLNPGESLTAGEHALTQQADGNLVLTRSRGGTKTVEWATDTGGHPGAYTAFQNDGHLVQYATDGTALWWSATANKGSTLVLQASDGNAVIRDAGGTPLWTSKEQVYRIYAGQRLDRGQSRQSQDGRYVLHQQADGNLVFSNRSTKKVIWSSQTGGNPGAYTLATADGNLAVLSPDKRKGPLWSSATDGNPGARIVVQNDRNFVIYGARGEGVWAALEEVHRVYAGQRMRPNQVRTSQNGRFRLTQQGDGNLVLYDRTAKKTIWATKTGGHPGAFSQLQRDGNWVVIDANGKTPLWASGTGGTATRSYLDVQNDGNVVLVGSNGKVIFTTGTGGR